MTRVAAFLLAVLAVFAAEEKKKKPELPVEVQSIVDLARSTAPEFFAKMIADLVEKGAIPDREARIDLLDEAFAVAQSAKEPYPVVAVRRTPPDTRELHRSKAAELGLDALSLEARLVKEMTRIDPAKARSLFDAIPHPVPDAQPCEDSLIADISKYYEMAAGIAQSTFTPPEKEKNANVQFLEAVLDGARAPGELLPFLRTIKEIGLPREQWELLIGAFAAKMQSIGRDARDFASTYDALKSEVAGLAGPDRDRLVPVLRTYEIAQMGAAQCTIHLAVYNDAGLEIRESRIGGQIKVVAYDSADFLDLFAEFAKVKRMPVSDPDWSNQIDDFLRELSFWNPRGAEIDKFHQKATVFRALLDGIPVGEARDRVLTMCVDFLAASGEQQENPEQWLYQVEMLDRDPKMKDLFRASANPALLLYATYFSGSNGTSK